MLSLCIIFIFSFAQFYKIQTFCKSSAQDQRTRENIWSVARVRIIFATYVEYIVQHSYNYVRGKLQRKYGTAKSRIK